MTRELRKVLKVAHRAQPIIYGMLLARGFHRNLAGACGLASEALVRCLEREGLEADLVGGYWHSSRLTFWGHYWVESYENVIDLTLKQFIHNAPVVAVTSVGTPAYKSEIRAEMAETALQDENAFLLPCVYF